MKKRRSKPAWPSPTGALSGPEIWSVLHRPDDRLVIMPPFYDEEALRVENSIDLRLGHELILMRKAELSTLSFRKDVARDLHRFYERVYIDVDDDFLLHPGELVLGSTLEYIALPRDVMCYIIGRSSWGRLGLIIATAIVIHPGYKGCPTLELANTGNVPIQLFPGAPIPVAQLTLHWVGRGQEPYKGRYAGRRWVGPTGPEFSRIHVGEVFEKWIAYREGRRLHGQKILGGS